MNRLLIVAISFGIMFAFWSFLQHQSQKGSFAQISDQYDRAIGLFESNRGLVQECQSIVADADGSWIDTLSDDDDRRWQMETSSSSRSRAEGDDHPLPDNIVVCSASWDGKQKSLAQVMRFVFEINAKRIEMNLESVECTARSNPDGDASTPETWNCKVAAKYLSEAQSNAKTSKNP